MPSAMTGLSPASSDLGLGGSLSSQVEGETEEQRKKRMQEAQQRQLMGPMGSMAVTALGVGRGGY